MRDEVDRLAALHQAEHLLEDAAVRVAEEVRVLDELDGLVDGLRVQQDRPEHGALGFEVVRQRAIDGGVGHGEDTVRIQKSEVRVTSRRIGTRPSRPERRAGLADRPSGSDSSGFYASAVGASASGVTFTVSWATTSRCSLTGTVNSPICFSGSARLDLALVDLEPLAGEDLGDVGRGHRPVQGVVLADAAGDDDLELRQPRGQRLGARPLRGLAARRRSCAGARRPSCWPRVAGSASLRGSRKLRA